MISTNCGACRILVIRSNPLCLCAINKQHIEDRFTRRSFLKQDYPRFSSWLDFEAQISVLQGQNILLLEEKMGVFVSVVTVVSLSLRILPIDYPI